MHKIFCLLSGGIDSSTTLAIAANDFPDDPIEAVTINYGQRHIKERACANTQAHMWGADHTILNAQNLMTGMLVDKGVANEDIPEASYDELGEGISPTYVSFRNGLMLSMLASRAQGWVMEKEKDKDLQPGTKVTATIYIGVHADDGVNWAYPDCTPEFIGPMAAAIFVGSYHKVRLRAPLLFDTKPDVVMKGYKLGVNFAETWSCYKGESKHCGKCPTCLSRREAFDLNGLADPTEYAA